MELAGIGRVVFWEGGSLWLALITGGNSLHMHHAIQICLPLDGEVRFRQSSSDAWVSYHGAVITPGLPHAFDAPGRVVANILFEPESRAGRSLLANYAPGISGLRPDDVTRLVAPIATARARDVSDTELAELARNVIAELSGAEPHTGATDSRVLDAIRHIRAHIDEPMPLERVARASGLSPGRLRHLFVSQTGVSTRAFVLWERLNRALEIGFGGASWTEAAHAANFADSAHLTRTCRRMLGLAPTAGRISRTLAATVASTEKVR